MGCDIHVHIEVLIEGKWYHYMPLQCPRHYDVFSRMSKCGRGQYEPIIERGFPSSNASLITELSRSSYQGIDHSHNWLYLKEILEISEEFPNFIWNFDAWANYRQDEIDQFEGIYLFEHSIKSFYSDNHLFPCDNVRFVFWFDN